MTLSPARRLRLILSFTDLCGRWLAFWHQRVAAFDGPVSASGVRRADYWLAHSIAMRRVGLVQARLVDHYLAVTAVSTQPEKAGRTGRAECENDGAYDATGRGASAGPGAGSSSVEDQEGCLEIANRLRLLAGVLINADRSARLRDGEEEGQAQAQAEEDALETPVPDDDPLFFAPQPPENGADEAPAPLTPSPHLDIVPIFSDADKRMAKAGEPSRTNGEKPSPP